MQSTLNFADILSTHLLIAEFFFSEIKFVNHRLLLFIFIDDNNNVTLRRYTLHNVWLKLNNTDCALVVNKRNGSKQGKCVK